MSKQYKMNRPQWDSRHVQALRRYLGLTQQQLAETLVTRQQTISEWETGMYKPRGASATLLSIIAERAKFNYQAILTKKIPKKYCHITL
jgi:DNA-binding transcriptional regulator YiaG